MPVSKVKYDNALVRNYRLDDTPDVDYQDQTNICEDCKGVGFIRIPND